MAQVVNQPGPSKEKFMKLNIIALSAAAIMLLPQSHSRKALRVMLPAGNAAEGF